MVLTLRYDDEKGDANLSELYKIPKEFQWRLRPLEMITSTFEESIRFIFSSILSSVNLTEREGGMPVTDIHGLASCMNSGDPDRKSLAIKMSCFLLMHVIDFTKQVMVQRVSMEKMFSDKCCALSGYPPEHPFRHRHGKRLLLSTFSDFFGILWKTKKDSFQKVIKNVAAEYALTTRLRDKNIPNDVPERNRDNKAIFYLYKNVGKRAGSFVACLDYRNDRVWHELVTTASLYLGADGLPSGTKLPSCILGSMPQAGLMVTSCAESHVSDLSSPSSEFLQGLPGSGTNHSSYHATGTSTTLQSQLTVGGVSIQNKMMVSNGHKMINNTHQPLPDNICAAIVHPVSLDGRENGTGAVLPGDDRKEGASIPADGTIMNIPSQKSNSSLLDTFTGSSSVDDCIVDCAAVPRRNEATASTVNDGTLLPAGEGNLNLFGQQGTGRILGSSEGTAAESLERTVADGDSIVNFAPSRRKETTASSTANDEAGVLPVKNSRVVEDSEGAPSKRKKTAPPRLKGKVQGTNKKRKSGGKSRPKVVKPPANKIRKTSQREVCDDSQEGVGVEVDKPSVEPGDLKTWSNIGYNGYDRSYITGGTGSYPAKVRKGGEEGRLIDQNRWCVPCKLAGRKTDLLDKKLGRDSQGNAFYAKEDLLIGGGACHRCFGGFRDDGSCSRGVKTRGVRRHYSSG